MAFVMHHFLSADSEVHFRRRNMRFSWQQISSILSIGMSPFFLQLLSSGVAFLINKTLADYAESPLMADRAVGAYGIINSAALVGFMFMVGIAQGMQPIVGFNYGARALPRVRQTFQICSATNLGIGLLMTLSAVVAPGLISSLFTSSPEMIEASVHALRLCLYGFAFVGFQVTATQFFQSIGFGGKALLLSISRQTLFLIPALLLFPRLWGSTGVWLALPFSDICSGVLGMALMYYQFRIFDRQFGEGR